MKSYFLLLLAGSLLCQVAQAQTERTIVSDERSYTKIFDSLASGLSASRIPSGALYNRVYPWSGLDRWKSGDSTSTAHLYQSWFDAEQSVINPVRRNDTYTAMRENVQRQLSRLRLPLVVINFQFAMIDEMAEKDGRLLQKKGILTDAGLASPYQIKRICVAGLALDKPLAGQQYLLSLNREMELNNTGQPVAYIEINNLTTGEQVTLKPGVETGMKFTRGGKQVLRFTVYTDQKSTFVIHQTIQVKEVKYDAALNPIGPNCTPTNDLIESDIPFKGYSESQATNSFSDYHIYYHTQSPTATDCERVLRKPVIILDGFDPQDKRDYNELYTNFLTYNNNGTTTLLGNDLRDKGYDVIILNFPKLGSFIPGLNGEPGFTIPSNVKVNGSGSTINAFNRDGGTDYIERNAFVLVKLIQQLNAALAANGSTENLVIVGPSMGGQISRYALAYMEQQQAQGVPGMNHNTRLWVAYDSPNDGANIPMALHHNLYFYGYVGGSQSAKDSYEQQLNSVAARQLLIEQRNFPNSSSSFHTAFYNGIRANGLPGSLGYPVNLRKVSLLNGTDNGQQTYWDGAEILRGEGKKTFLNIKVFEINDFFMPATGQNAMVAKNRIAIPGFLSLTIITESYFYTNNNNRGCMDAVQGSTFNATQDVFDGLRAVLNEEGVRQSWPVVRPLHCFIPSISALGFKNSNFNWRNAVNNRNLVCTNEIVFDNYFVPNRNEDHITLTPANVEWITQEIDRGVAGCPSICTNAVIGGANQLCVNEISTYQLDATPPASTTVEWLTDPFYQIVSYTNTTVTIRALSTAAPIIVKARIINPCGANREVVSRSITGSGPEVSGIRTNLNSCLGGSDWELWLTAESNNPSVTDYVWTKDGNVITTGANLYLYEVGSNCVQIGVRAENACGVGTEYTQYFCPPCGFVMINVTPNPVKDRMVVSVRMDEQAKKNAGRQVTVSLYRFNNAMLVKQWRLPAGQQEYSLSVAGIPKGQYIAEVVTGGVKKTKQVIIE